MIVLIPAFEPTAQMLNVIKEIKENTDFEILVVDDGSGKKYRELFEKAENYGCVVLHHAENKGKGEALKTGFLYLLSQNSSDNVVCADSDGQHQIKDIINVANAIDEKKSEMILGVRKFEGKVPAKSRIGNSLTAVIFNAATGMYISDTQTGLRGYPNSLLEWLCTVDGSRFEYELNLLLKAKEEGIEVKQIPILTIYENNNKGTHFRPLRDSLRVYFPLFKFSCSSFASAIIDFSLLFVFQAVTGSLFWSVVLARVISSVFNYSVNKVLVFKSKNLSNTQSAPKYFGLVIVIMLLNYSLIEFMTHVLYFPTVLAKLLAELILFIISYIVQKGFVFEKNFLDHKNEKAAAKQH